MPIISHHTIEPEGELGLWQISEYQSWFLRRLKPTGDELKQLEQIKGKSRRLEWMAVRWLLHKMSGRRKRAICLKDEHGKPHLVDSPWEISFSHSKQLVTVIAAPMLVGIDIQNITPSIERIAHKFMREEELKSLKSKTRLEHLHVYWGAKEALYKAYGRRKLDFRTHIFVRPFKYDVTFGRCEGYVIKDDFEMHFNLFYKKIDNHMLVYAVEKDL